MDAFRLENLGAATYDLSWQRHSTCATHRQPVLHSVPVPTGRRRGPFPSSSRRSDKCSDWP